MSELYFAYGSNLSFAQMSARCPSSRFVARATLPGHRLAFPRTAASWEGGGVAGIEPDAARRVEGVVYEMTHDDLLALDGFEGCAHGHYRRERIAVRLEDGVDRDAWVYFAAAMPGAPFAPSRRYLDTILRGAREHGLPPAYITELGHREKS